MRTSRNSRSEKFSFLSFLVARSGPSKLTPQGVCTPVGENCSSERQVGLSSRHVRESTGK